MLRLTTGCGVALCASAGLMLACSEGAAVPSPSGNAGAGTRVTLTSPSGGAPPPAEVPAAER